MKQTNFVLLSALVLLALLCTTAFADFGCSYSAGGGSYNFKGFPIIQGTSDTGQDMTLSLCTPLESCDKAEKSVICQPSMPKGIDYGNLHKTPKPHAIKVSGGVALSFSNGSEACYDSNLSQPYRTRVVLSCSDVQSTTFSVVRGSGCERIINLESPFGCASGDDSLSGGAIFLIVIFSLWAAYFVIGFLVCKFYLKKATITEAIPHFAFWVSLPGWYVAGIKIAVAFVQSKLGKKSAGGDYESSDSYGATDEAV